MRGRLKRFLVNSGGVGRRGSRGALYYEAWERGFCTYLGE